MKAYLIHQVRITDKTQYQKYREAVGAVILKFGGKFLVRGAKVEVLEGHHDGRRLVVTEFPSMEAIHAFWNSPEFAEVKKLRIGTATVDLWAVQGV
jgi:uncharacterized protein (DUF1330 family)